MVYSIRFMAQNGSGAQKRLDMYTSSIRSLQSKQERLLSILWQAVIFSSFMPSFSDWAAAPLVAGTQLKAKGRATVLLCGNVEGHCHPLRPPYSSFFDMGSAIDYQRVTFAHQVFPPAFPAAPLLSYDDMSPELCKSP